VIPVETTLGMGGGMIKENDRGGDFKYDWYIVRTFVSATKYPHTAQ
jgi:hypothetical protein